MKEVIKEEVIKEEVIDEIPKEEVIEEEVIEEEIVKEEVSKEEVVDEEVIDEIPKEEVIEEEVIKEEVIEKEVINKSLKEKVADKNSKEEEKNNLKSLQNSTFKKIVIQKKHNNILSELNSIMKNDDIRKKYEELKEEKTDVVHKLLQTLVSPVESHPKQVILGAAVKLPQIVNSVSNSTFNNPIISISEDSLSELVDIVTLNNKEFIEIVKTQLKSSELESIIIDLLNKNENFFNVLKKDIDKIIVTKDIKIDAIFTLFFYLKSLYKLLFNFTGINKKYTLEISIKILKFVIEIMYINVKYQNKIDILNTIYKFIDSYKDMNEMEKTLQIKKKIFSCF